MSVDETLRKALGLGEEGRWEEMARLLGDELESAPDDPYLLCWLGVAEQELGNEGAAYEYFRRAVAQDPSDPNLLAMAGSGLAGFDDPEAEAVLRAAALAGPDVPAARLQYGAYLAREGLFAEALEQLAAALELVPDDPVVHGELGVAHALRGDLDGAAQAMERTLELAPDDAWTRVLLGLVLVEAGSLDEAAEALMQAADERETDTEAHLLAALAAAAVGWDDAAHEALARAEYAAEGDELTLAHEVEQAIMGGGEAARRLLADSIGPVVLRERLHEPL